MKKILTLFVILLAFMQFASAQTDNPKPVVVTATYFDVSPPLRDMVKISPDRADMTWKDGVVKNILHPDRPRPVDTDDPNAIDRGVQNWNGTLAPDSVQESFDGVGNTMGLCPPDTDGDVGPDNYFQVVNCKYAIYSKTGSLLLGPVNNSSIFSGMPNNSNDGDAVVLYDEMADRWVFTQFSLPNFPAGPFFQMVAVSQTSDPTGSWYRYQYQFTDMPDYPKISVWPDAYYLSFNRFTANSLNYNGTGAVALNRDKMLAGLADANMVYFTLNASNEAYCFLPSDCDGTFPPMGTPNYFWYLNDGPDRIGMYQFHVDWNNTGSSTFQQSALITVSPFTGGIQGGIPQKNTTVKLDAMSGRLMFRTQFRTFADHWSMVACATVNVGSNVAGIRWFELRRDAVTPWSIYQQGTYSPDSHCRWMGSIAMDADGNMLLGYSVSSTTKFPSIYYTGRMAGDPLHTMTINEGIIKEGLGSQTNTWSGNPSRWGDYSAMSVDPSVPAKFWYTQEYYQTTNSSNWKTRIGSVTLTPSTNYALNGIITYPGNNPTALSGITVNLKDGTGTLIGTTVTNASGAYSFGNLINGSYTLEPSTTKAWGGVTAADVLLYRKHIANISLLTGIFLASGDVNGSGSLTAADVLLVKKRIGSIITGFTVGDWLFNNPAVTINGANVTQDFNGLCYGDANASYVPPAGKSTVTPVITDHHGMLEIGQKTGENGIMTVPVLAGGIPDLGSFQFTISYDPAKLVFERTENWFDGTGDVTVGNPEPGRLTFVWASDLQGLSLANGKLFDLIFRAVSDDAAPVTWCDTPTPRELADYSGNLFEPVYKSAFAAEDQLTLFPNPARDVVTMRAAETIKTVKIYNSNGQMVLEKPIGSANAGISISGFKPGNYLFRAETFSGTLTGRLVVE